MSCPDWSRLAGDHRTAEAAAAEEPVAWREALEHLDGCTDCRDDALAADPVLLFRNLPAIDVDAADVDDMRTGVAALRRAQRVAASVEGLREHHGPSRWWGRAAAAAVLAIGLLAVRPAAEDPSRAAAEPWNADSPVPVALLEASTVSSMDDIHRPTASEYYFDDGEVGVLLVVDAGFDV